MALIGKKRPKNAHFCQIWSIMKMSNNPNKYEVLIKQYLRSILDVSSKCGCECDELRSMVACATCGSRVTSANHIMHSI